MHRRRPFPAKRLEIGLIDLPEDAVAWGRASAASATRDLPSNATAMVAGILTITSPQRVIDFLIRLLGCDGDGASYAVASPSLEASGTAATIVVDMVVLHVASLWFTVSNSYRLVDILGNTPSHLTGTFLGFQPQTAFNFCQLSE